MSQWMIPLWSESAGKTENLVRDEISTLMFTFQNIRHTVVHAQKRLSAELWFHVSIPKLFTVTVYFPVIDNDNRSDFLRCLV